MAEHKLGRIFRRRTSSAILLIQLVTNILAELIFMVFKPAKMASTKLARQQMVRATLSETTQNSRFKGVLRATRQLVPRDSETTNSKLSPTTTKSDRRSSPVSISFFSTELLNLSFALSRDCDGVCRHYTHSDARKRTLFLVHAPQRIIRAFPVWERHIGSR